VGPPRSRDWLLDMTQSTKTSFGVMTDDRVVAFLSGFSLLSVFVLPSQSAASFSTYALALILLVGGVGRWRAFLQTRELAALVVIVLVYFSASVWWSPDVSPRGAFSIYSRCLLVLTFIVAFSTSLRRVPDFATWLARSVAICGASAALCALYDFQQHPTWDDRLIGMGQLHNSVVAALAFDAALLFALHVAAMDSVRWRIVGAACATSIAVAIAQTGSRAGYLGAMIGIWIMFIGARFPTSPRRLLWLSAPLWVGAVIGVALALLRPDVLPTLFPRGDSFRIEIWNAEWRRLLEHPLFGRGILARDDVDIDGQRFLHPHNLYLASALQGGLLGLLLLATLLVRAAWQLLENLQVGVARLGLALLAAGMSAYLFDGWELIDKVGLSWLLLWVPVAMAAAVSVRSVGEHTRDMVGVNSPGRSSESSGFSRDT
jgi:O-antigen ligase